MEKLLGHERGPGIAANVIMLKLLDLLVQNDVITRDDMNLLLASADATIAQWGASNVGVQDARAVIAKMRGLGS
jgi:hypothetical protein